VKTVKTVPVPEVDCFLLGDKKADKTFCLQQSGVFRKNQEYCRKNNCPSPWRKCWKCITLGKNGDSGSIVDPLHGLCKDHLAFAEEDASSLLKNLRQAYEKEILPDGLRRLTLEHRQELARFSKEEYLKKRYKEQNEVTLTAGQVAWIDVGCIRPRYDQPRKCFNLYSIFELARSRESEQVTSIILDPIENDPEGFSFVIRDGERRWLSALISNSSKIKSEVAEKRSLKDTYLISAVANFCKEDHTPLEILEMIQRIMKEHGMSVSAVSRALGRSDTWGQQHLRLGNVHSTIIKMLEDGKISLTTASELGKYSKDFQMRALNTITSEKMSTAVAKMHIRNELGKAGLPIKTGKRGRRPSDDYEILKAFIKSFIGKSDGLLRMGNEKLRNMFSHRDQQEKEVVIAELDSLMGRISDIKEAIE
jgi:ParB family chromosome partitioning protein